MRWVRLVFAGALVSSLIVGLLHTPARAISGCCLELADGSWSRTSKSFEDCMEANMDDGDNILDRSGRFWWDTSCR